MLAVGAQARAFHPAVLTFDGPEAVPAVRELVSDLTHARAESVALVVPAGVTWALPMYELALMLRGRARRRRVLLVTSEPAPLAVFGEEPSRAVAEMLARAGVEIHVGVDPTVADGWARHRALRRRPVALRRPHRRAAAARRPSACGASHTTQRGFIPVDEHGRVPGLDHVYAAGDGTDLAIKQGGLAAQQADAAIRHLTARGRRAAAPGSVPSCPARQAHDRPGRSLPAPRSRRPATPCSTSPCGSPPRRWSATTSRPGWRTCIPRIPLPRNDIERVTVDHELDLEPLGRIERQRS